MNDCCRLGGKLWKRICRASRCANNHCTWNFCTLNSRLGVVGRSTWVKIQLLLLFYGSLPSPHLRPSDCWEKTTEENPPPPPNICEPAVAYLSRMCYKSKPFFIVPPLPPSDSLLTRTTGPAHSPAPSVAGCLQPSQMKKPSTGSSCMSNPKKKTK